ncbi:phosphomevalonate kinase [Rickenella mellea]|uniref:Phosphomevalonate kinase n=1 Tax=Rickenella mellea TaxID=50990 RepID=A0A4Y7Q9A9_9AGAM|nr:phosphomevalonate kinase [Rickenella mellea]
MSSTVVSAPGKVLIAGGYLVLDQKYSGIVVSTSSRFYTVIQPAQGRSFQIRVRSPQFEAAVWTYAVHLDTELDVRQTSELSSKNKFVQLALHRTLQLALEMKGEAHFRHVLNDGLEIAIMGDNDFYSQRAKLAELNLVPLIASLAKIPPFTPTGVKLADVHKTGLGSSAALITSLVAALLLHLGVIPPSALDSVQNEGRALVHNTAQYIHCLAQGKVGSGFDVSSAVFGSQLYTRFDPAVIKGLMSDNATNTPLLPVLSPSNNAWDYRVAPFKLPPQTRLMLADIDAGSDTPSLVGQVLRWRTSQPAEANAFWDQLSESNDALCRTLLRLSELSDEDTKAYTSCVKYLSSLQPLQWVANPHASPHDARFAQTFYEAHRLTEDIRSRMREMGRLSDVPIEPPEQVALLDACMSQAGVIGGGVPGAGGYDAIWLLVLDPSVSSPEDRPLSRVERVWTSWKALDVSPLSATESLEKGLRLEQIDNVPGMRAALGQ